MSEVCCDLCAYWLPQFKECGNTHINKCINKEHFVKVERNCGTCEREIRAEAINEFAGKLKNRLIVMQIRELRGKDVCPCAETGEECPYINQDIGCQYCAREQTIKDIDEIAEQMKGDTV